MTTREDVRRYGPATVTVREDFLDFEARKMKEAGGAGLQEKVRRLCLSLRVFEPNILFYHPFDSRKSTAGYPDCTIVLPSQGRLIYAELKTYTGRPTVAQGMWLDRLSCLTTSADLRRRIMGKYDACECYLWRPQHYLHDTIRLILRGNPEAATYPLGRWRPFQGVDGDPYSEVR